MIGFDEQGKSRDVLRLELKVIATDLRYLRKVHPRMYDSLSAAIRMAEERMEGLDENMYDR